MRKSLALLLVLVFIIASSIATPLPVKAEPKTIVVPDDFLTIQAAIDTASAGDTILVRAGNYTIKATYHNLLGSESLFINKSISLIGENCQDTVITTKGYATYDSGIHITAGNVTISGFTIVGNANAVFIDYGSAKVYDNIINMTEDSIAIFAAGSGNTLLSSNTINGFGKGFNGINVENTGVNTISNNFINGFHIGISNGIKNVNIFNNTLTNNAIGFYTFQNPLSFSYNNIYNSTQSSIYQGSADVIVTYNWWGTTDAKAIDQMIPHYFPNHSPMGNVTYIPFLTEPNPQAMPNPHISVPIPKTTPSPTLTPPPTGSRSAPSNSIEVAVIVIIAFVVVVLVGVGLLVYFKKRKR
jgi:hypothetical protein